METKPILVFYFNVDELSTEKIAENSFKLNEMLKTEELNKYITFIIPVRNQPTKVECINPVLVSKKEYNIVKETLEKTEKILKDYFIQ
jgi:hypothetical protein